LPVFEYSAVDVRGNPEKGFARGETMEEALRQLSSRGLQVQNITATGGFSPVEPAAPTEEPRQAAALGENPREEPRTHLEERSVLERDVAGPLVGGVPLTDLHFFFRQFSTMIEAGVGMSQTLQTLAAQQRHPKLRRVLDEAAQQVPQGRYLSETLERYPEVFSPLMMSMVRMGEKGGFLGIQTKNLAEYIQRDIELRNLIRRETAYPKIIVAASIVVIGGANMVIAALAPQGQRLWSPLTEWQTWLVLGPLLLVGFVAYCYSRYNGSFQHIWTGFIQKIPWVGKVAIGFAMAKFGRAFGALYKAGIPFPVAVRYAADACGNEDLRRRMHPAAIQLEQGASISQAFTETGAFSPIVMDMVTTGEMTGNMEEMMVKMSEYYEDEGAVQTRQMAMILGVVAFILVAIYVLILLITFYSGYFGGMMRGA
jgi:type IV pilus assembly protein PilC/MSHA biogenesis protein MshG